MKHFLHLLYFLLTASICVAQPPYKRSDLSAEHRAKDLVSRLSLKEKISLLGYNSKAVPRLDIPAYNWWNEALHGVARAGEATVFPQAIGLAATFDDKLLFEVATTISTEARAKYNLSVAKDLRDGYRGLTFWAPNINIFRDPRWGRGHETYGEDPFLTATLGLSFVKGMQGSDSLHLKTAACAKHYAVHSGPEGLRHEFDALVDAKDLRETYLPAFRKLVTEGNVEAVMGAYNRVNGEPATIGPTLINILRKEWGFRGHFLTDCWALQDIYKTHKVLPNSVAVAAAAVKAGVNLDCSNLLQDDLLQAVTQKLLTEKEIDQALTQLLKTQFKLGFYDNRKVFPYAAYGRDSIRSANHLALARKAAAESMVILKNHNNLLPLKKEKLSSIYITGTNAFAAEVLQGNYNGQSPDLVTFSEGITRAVAPHVSVMHNIGCTYDDTANFAGVWYANSMDVTIAVVGLSPLMEGEEGDAFLSKHAADRANLSLPRGHVAFLKKIKSESKKPIIAVVTGGSAVDIKEIEPFVDAIILVWYPGEQGGNALADVLFGNISPAGRLPITFYNSVDDLPPYTDYNMKNRTYRYFKGPVQYPFGFGLSYTTFQYQWIKKPANSLSEAESLVFQVNVSNVGTYDGDEVVQAYIQYPVGERMPLKELKGFKRVTVQKGATRNVTFKIPAESLKKWDLQEERFVLVKGQHNLFVGGHSANNKIATTFSVR